MAVAIVLGSPINDSRLELTGGQGRPGGFRATQFGITISMPGSPPRRSRTASRPRPASLVPQRLPRGAIPCPRLHHLADRPEHVIVATTMMRAGGRVVPVRRLQITLSGRLVVGR
jgi:hypothetical protein